MAVQFEAMPNKVFLQLAQMTHDEVRPASVQLVCMVVTGQHRTGKHPARPRRLHVMFHVANENRFPWSKAVVGQHAADSGAFVAHFDEHVVQVLPKTRRRGLRRIMVPVHAAQKKGPQPAVPTEFKKRTGMWYLGHQMLAPPKRGVEPLFELRHRNMRHVPVVETGKRQTKLAAESVERHLRDPRLLEDVIAGLQYRRQVIYQRARPIEDYVSHHGFHSSSCPPALQPQ